MRFGVSRDLFANPALRKAEYDRNMNEIFCLTLVIPLYN